VNPRRLNHFFAKIGLATRVVEAGKNLEVTESITSATCTVNGQYFGTISAVGRM